MGEERGGRREGEERKEGEDEWLERMDVLDLRDPPAGDHTSALSMAQVRRSDPHFLLTTCALRC